MRKKQPNSYWKNRRLQQKQKQKPMDVGVRICLEQDCTVVLNQYNRNDCCSLHNFAYMKREKKFVNISDL
jgi:hypothetical protein